MLKETENQIILTANFSKWLANLKNPIAKATIARRIKNAINGHFSDHKALAGTGGIKTDRRKIMEQFKINEEMAEKHGLHTFDVAEFLNDEETIQAYLAEVLKEGDQDLFIEALNDVARARGMTQLAKDTGLGRESLYKTLSKGSKPRFETIQKILGAFNLALVPQVKQRLNEPEKIKNTTLDELFS